MSDYKSGLHDISHISKESKILFVTAEFNRNYTEAMEQETETFLNEQGFHDIDKILVPWAFEIPAMLGRVLDTGKYDLIYTFGVIIRGDTDHYTYVCQEASRGIMDMSMNYDTPIVFGLLTCENNKQVEERINSHLAISGLNLLATTLKI